MNEMPRGGKPRAGARILKRPKPKQQTGFFDLPLEIRDMVYSRLLVEEKPMKLSMSSNVTNIMHFCLLHRPSPSCGLQPQVLRVNRRFHEEASRILYGHNIFVFDDTHECCPHPNDDIMSLDPDDADELRHNQECHDFKLFLLDIGRQNTMLLRKLQFCFGSSDTCGRGPFRMLKEKTPRYPGKSFADGFRMLAQGHSLQSLHIKLDGCYMAEAMEQGEELLDAITKLQNVPDLQIDSTCKCDDNHMKNALGNVRYQLVEGRSSSAYQFKQGKDRWNFWGNAQQIKGPASKDSEDQLANTIQRLGNEMRVLETRIAEDTERRDFISKMLGRARSAVSL